MSHDLLRIEIPIAPPTGLLTNHRHRGHWAVTSEATKALKWEAKSAMMQPPPEPVQHYDLDVTVVWGPDEYPSEARFPDVDNLPPAIKPAIDMLQHQRYIVNDRLCHDYTIRQKMGEAGRIILEVRPR